MLVVLWSAGVLYGSLAPQDGMPAAGWFGRIPHVDKIVHFGFYAGEVFLAMHLVPARGWAKWALLAGIVALSGAIEVAQELWFGRSGDLADFAANCTGALAGMALWVAMRRRPASSRQRPWPHDDAGGFGPGVPTP